MKISKQQLIREIAEKTEYPVYSIQEVFTVLQQLVYDHMRNMDDVHIFEGVTLSGVIKKAHMHTINSFGGVIEMPDYVTPKATFSDGLKHYLRGLRGKLR